MATFQLVNARGYPTGQDPIRNGESFTTWTVTDDGVLHAIPRNDSAYGKQLLWNHATESRLWFFFYKAIKPYLRSRDADTNNPRIRAYMDDPSDPVTSSMQFLVGFSLFFFSFFFTRTVSCSSYSFPDP